MKPRKHMKSVPGSKPVSKSITTSSKSRSTSNQTENKTLRSILLETLKLLQNKENQTLQRAQSAPNLISIAKQIHKKVQEKLCMSNKVETNPICKLTTHYTQKSMDDISFHDIKVDKVNTPKKKTQLYVSSKAKNSRKDTEKNEASTGLNISMPASRLNILSYFQDKFNSPLAQSQDKLRALEIIKKSQDASRYHSKSIDPPKIQQPQLRPHPLRNLFLTERVSDRRRE